VLENSSDLRDLLNTTTLENVKAFGKFG